MKVHRSFGIILCIIGAVVSFTAAVMKYRSTHSGISALFIPLAYLMAGLVCVALIGVVIRRKWGNKW